MNIPGMGNLMKKAQEMQKNMKKMEEEIAAMTVTGEAGAGLVKVMLTGNFECTKITIDPELMKEEQEMLEDLIAAAINDAVRKVESEKKDKMSSVTSGLSLPAGFDSFLK